MFNLLIAYYTLLLCPVSRVLSVYKNERNILLSYHVNHQNTRGFFSTEENIEKNNSLRLVTRRLRQNMPVLFMYRWIKLKYTRSLTMAVSEHWLDGSIPTLKRKSAAHYGHSYALSVNVKCEKPFGHSVKIFGVLQWLLTHNLKNPDSIS